MSPRGYRRFSPFTTRPLLAENQQPLASDPNFRSNNTGLNKALCVHRGARLQGTCTLQKHFPLGSRLYARVYVVQTGNSMQS